MSMTARRGTTKKRLQTTQGPRACAVELVRYDRERARFYLDGVAQLELRPTVGDRLACELYYDTEDDELGAMVPIDVYAVHERGFVDAVHGTPLFEDRPDIVMLRRYPERPAP